MRNRRVAVVAGVLLTAAGAGAQAPTPPTYDPRAAFAETDTNHDGAIDHEEFVARMAEVFYRADVDKNGKLSSVEIVETLVQTSNLSAADTNKDGSLSLHEFTRARMLDYEQVDTNDDGLLEIDEVVSVYETKPKAKE